MKHTTFMKRAMALALKAKGMTSPNPLVGAVIVKGNKIIAEGFHRRCGTDHAEWVALKKAGSKAGGASLYVTLEPCSHYGRTPPCVDKIISSGIKNVYVGMRDPNPVNNGKSIAKLRKAGIKTQVGFLERELGRINEGFVKYITQKMPFVVAKTAQTLDGKIATSSGQSKWITSKKARDYSHQMRNDFDAILVGINTVVKDNPSLNASKQSKQLKKIIVDTQLRLSLNARIFKGTNPQDILVATTKKAKVSRLEHFRRKNVGIIIAPVRNGKIDLKWLFKELARREISHLLIEGGGTIIGNALCENLIDKMAVFISLKVMGDPEAIDSIRTMKATNVNQLRKLNNVVVKEIGEDILVEGYLH